MEEILKVFSNFVTNVIKKRKSIKQKLTAKKRYLLLNRSKYTLKRFSNSLIEDKIKITNKIIRRVHIYVKYEQSNIYLNSFYKNKGLVSQNLGEKGQRNRAAKLALTSYKRTINEFSSKLKTALNLVLKEQPKKKKKLKGVLRVRGKPYKKQLVLLLRGLEKIKRLKLLWVENYNSMVFKSGLREKKPRRV